METKTIMAIDTTRFFDFQQYVEDANRTKRSFELQLNEQLTDLLHGSVGVCTEGGELLDAVKKIVIYGKPVDVTNIKEELGDLMWYVAIICRALNLSMSEICKVNIDKLKARYPDKFTSESALNRNLDKEREILEGKK